MIIFDYLALLYLFGCLCIVGFQVALIAGAPWGKINQGGQHTCSLPLSGRIIAGVSIFLLLGMACAILSAAGLWPNWPIWTVWPALAVQGMSAVLNWITPSRPERILWGPIMSLMLVVALTVVFGN
ncbi:MAG: hypothetical protein AAGF71_04280 [Pseudomonadota bacterium]